MNTHGLSAFLDFSVNCRPYEVYNPIMEFLSRDFTIRNNDVNKFGVLRSSTMFAMFQNISDEHCAVHGAGSDDLLARGLIWILAAQRAVIRRMPRLGETVRFTTWVNEPRHGLYPRFYKIELPDSTQTEHPESAPTNTTNKKEPAPLVLAGSYWSVVEIDNRTLLGKDIPGPDFDCIVTGEEINLLRGPRVSKAAPVCVREFTVPYSYIDMNGHMNNTRYIDEAENVLPPVSEGRQPALINIRYSAEALQGELLTVSCCELLPAKSTSPSDAGYPDTSYSVTVSSQSGDKAILQFGY